MHISPKKVQKAGEEISLKTWQIAERLDRIEQVLEGLAKGAREMVSAVKLVGKIDGSKPRRKL